MTLSIRNPAVEQRARQMAARTGKSITAVVDEALCEYEARRGVEFFLGADAGFFRANNYLARDYRIGICRYFGIRSGPCSAISSNSRCAASSATRY